MKIENGYYQHSPDDDILHIKCYGDNIHFKRYRRKMGCWAPGIEGWPRDVVEVFVLPNLTKLTKEEVFLEVL